MCMCNIYNSRRVILTMCNAQNRIHAQCTLYTHAHARIHSTFIVIKKRMYQSVFLFYFNLMNILMLKLALPEYYSVRSQKKFTKSYSKQQQQRYQ